MGVNGVNGIERVDAGQMAMAQATDSVSKSIQNQITTVQRQMQEISGKEDLPVEEKMKRRQELQKEISSLNTRLRQHEAEVRKEQQAKAAAQNMQKSSAAANSAAAGGATDAGATDRAAGRGTAAGGATGRGTAAGGAAGRGATDAGATDRAAGRGTAASGAAGSGAVRGTEAGAGAEAATGNGTAEDKSVDTGMSRRGMEAMVSAGSAMEHARRQGTVVSRIEGGIGILKAEIRQDSGRGIEVERKEQELARMEERARKASEAQFSILGDAHQTMKEAAEPELAKTAERKGFVAEGKGAANTFFSTTNLSKEKNQNVTQGINFSVDIRG